MVSRRIADIFPAAAALFFTSRTHPWRESLQLAFELVQNTL
jgi:hypothetical protein